MKVLVIMKSKADKKENKRKEKMAELHFCTQEGLFSDTYEIR